MAKKNNQPTMKKLPAVREAVNELGVDASVGDVRQWVKDKYDLDLTDATAQNYVSSAKKELRERNGSAAARPTRKAVTQAPTPPKQVPPPVQAPMSKGASPGVDEIIEAITVLKGLAGKIGKGNLVKLLEAV